ncbi:MAG: DUF1460 domain-containing protein [Bacteriovoracaceae bacterium]|nr:DUF1460 domain-containing protein [Bacteriovoracaceae bacterium]
MKIFLFLLTLSLGAWAQVDIDNELAHHTSLNGTIARLDAFSSDYIGLPYGDGGPLGEGAQGRYDQDPLWRFDTFDCTTFVETMISLALSSNADEFQLHMREIRYADGRVDYVSRNHFPSRDWIPNNIQNGYLEDLTHQLVDPQNILTARALIDLPRHYQMKKLDELRVFDIPQRELTLRLEEWRAEGLNLKAEYATLDYIAIDWLVKHPEVLRKIPHGSIVNFVRPNWDLTSVAGTHMNVSHQGFIFQVNGITMLRHASSGGDKHVRQEPFMDYIKKFVGHATLKGVHFMGITK